MEFEPSFFDDEIREDFFIPSMIKRSWAMQLEVLEKIDQICRKHNIRWFAEYGTLIGAARHCGFIPWDDDLDISMFREDYIKFNDICRQELPEEYCVLNIYNQDEYDFFLTRVTCGNVIDTSAEYLNNHHGFPFVAGVDIFVIDYIYPEESRELERKEKAAVLFKYAEYIKANPEIEKNGELKEGLIAKIESETGLIIEGNHTLYNSVLRLIDQLFSECTGEGSAEVALMYFWVRNNNHRYSLDYYKNNIRLQFENILINSPIGYEKILRENYGQWWQSVRSGGIHDYPFYDEQEIMLINSPGHKSKYIYPFKPEQISAVISEKISIRTKNKEILDIVSKAYNLAQNLISTNQVNEAKELLEQVELISKDLDNRSISNDVIFLVHSFDNWSSLAPIYDKIASDPNINTYVMPIPWCRKNNDRSCNNYEINTGNAPEGINLTDISDYDFDQNKPAKIIFQIPFDEYSLSMSVDPQFYSSILYKNTEELILVPYFDMNNFSLDDEKLLKNMESLVLTPGMLYADRVFLLSESMKKGYLHNIEKKLKSYNDDIDELIEYFDDKIEVFDSIAVTEGKNYQEKEKNNKTILLYISISDFCDDSDAMLLKIKNILDVFHEYEENILIYWYIDPGFRDNLKVIKEESLEEFEEILRDFEDNRNLYIYNGGDISELIKQADAFYGSPGYIMNQCVRRKMPVMIMDKNILKG